MQGTKFGRYQLVELIGRGGMGEVWRAHDEATDRVVALKVLPAHLAHDEVFKERFRREAHAAARLSEPHVVPIHNYGEIDDRLYVDMRLIEGRDLQSLLGDGPLDPARAVVIIEQVAQALQAAHKVGLVHRDVKPSNILVAEFDFSYLIDFGIARGAGESSLTSTGSMIGTWHYMAPERLSSGYADSRSDIYALACVLHECLTGDRPFPGDSLERQIAAHLMDPPPRPSIARRGVPAEFDTVVAKGMAKNPDARYPTTMALASAARAATTVPIPRPPSAPPAPATEPARSPFAPTQRRSPPAGPRPQPPPSAAARYPDPGHFVPAQSPDGEPRKAGAGRIVAIGLGAAAVLAAAIVATALIVQRSSGGSSSNAVTATERTTNVIAPTISSTTVSLPTTPSTPTTLPAPAPAPSPSPQSNTALNVSVPMSHPSCDGMGIVVLGNATNPGSYAAEIQGLLNANPGAQYLRTDESCPSLRQADDNGNPIYSVYRPAGRTQAEVCAAVYSAGGPGAGRPYGKWLDTTSAPTHNVSC